MEQRRRVVFVGNELAEDLFGEIDPLGEKVMIHGSPFLVIGVLQAKEQDSSYSGRDHSKMIIPSTTFQALTGQRYVDLFIYKAATPDQNKALTERVLAALGERKRFDPTRHARPSGSGTPPTCSSSSTTSCSPSSSSWVSWGFSP